MALHLRALLVLTRVTGAAGASRPLTHILYLRSVSIAGGGLCLQGLHRPPKQPNPCDSDSFWNWLYENVSIEGGIDGGVGVGLSGSIDANLNEISADGAFGGIILGTDSHAGVDIQLSGPGLQQGAYGLTQICGGLRGIGACVSFAQQAGHTTTSLTFGTVNGYSFVNALAYHIPLLGPAPFPGSTCNKK